MEIGVPTMASKSSVFQTYIHQRADDQKVFYVGKGSAIRSRATNGRNQHWRAVVAKHGYTITMCGIWETEAEAFEHERFLIACFRDMGAPLVNKTDGGDGISGHRHSAVAKEKIAAAMTPQRRQAAAALGRLRMTPQVVASMLAAAKAARTPEGDARRVEAARSPTSRAKISAAGIGRKHTAQTIAKRAAANTGKKRTAETRAKISAANKGQVVSLAQRQHLSIINKGKKLSEEAKNKISAAHKGRKLTPEHIAKSAAARVGKKRTAEQCARIAAATKQALTPERIARMLETRKGYVQSAATKEKRRLSLQAVRQTAEYRAKISAALKGRSRSAETKAKIAIAAVAREAAKRKGATDVQ